MRARQRQRAKRQLYTVHTATAAYGCMVCGGRIAPGEQYTRRRYRTHRGEYVTLRKCKRCVKIRAEQ